MPYLNGRQYSGYKGINLLATNGALRFETPSVTPTTTSGERLLYINSSDQLIYDNGATTTVLGAAGGAGGTLDSAYDNGASVTVDVSTITLTQTLNDTGIYLNKTGTGAGVPLYVANAGTADDLWLYSTKAAAVGVVIDCHHKSASPADNDVILEIEANGDDDGANKTEYASLQVLATDVTDATEDALFRLNLMLAGTQRQIINVAGDLLTYGSGTANAVVSSNGAYDLILETNEGTNSGTIRIYDGVDGNIEIDANGVGDLTLPNTGIVQGGTTATRCTFSVGGTTGAGFSVASATITSGDVVRINHSVSGTLDGGNLLSLQIDGTAYYSFGEVALTIAGTAGSNVLAITAGDVVFSDASLTITDADNAATLDITNDTATTIGAAADAGVIDIDSESLSTGALVNLSLDETNLTTGWYLRCYGQDAAANVFSVGEFGATVITDTNATATPLTITANSATTVTGGLIAIAANALTTGIAILASSTSLDLAAGQLLNLDHTASGTLSVAKTGQLVDIVSSRTHTAATAISDDYDGLSVIRTSVVNNAGGTLNEAGSVAYFENNATQTAGTMADTSNGVEIVMNGGAEAQGYGLSITHSGTSVGRVIDVVASQTTSTVALLTMNSLTTTGVGLSLTNTGTGMTTGSVLRVASGTTSAVATNGVISLFATGAFTSTAITDGFVRVNGNSTLTGTIMAVNGNALTSGVGVYVGDTGTGMTSGSLIRAVSASTGAVATNGILSVQATGAYTSTTNMGILAAIANTTTAGTVAYISATSMVGGTLLFLNATAATLTGKYIQCYDGAADDFSVGQYGAVIIAGNEGSNVLSITAGDVVFSQGSVTLTDNDNAASVSITNDTATTIGAGVDGGVVTVSADGLTTGSALNIGLTEGTLTTGHYLKCWDVTGGVAVASIEEDGELNIVGGRATTAGGADAINIGVSAAIKVLWGSGAPTATAPQGSLYMRTDGSSTSTRLYVNTDGAGTWTNVTTAA